MPGFVDTHRHTWQTPVRGVLPSCTLDQYFSGMLDNIGIQYRAEDVYIANLMGALECSERRHHDAARLVARQQHAGACRRRDRGARRGRHSRRVRARPSRRRVDVVGVQLEGASRGRAAHPQAILQLRRSAPDARARGARARQHDAGGREARLEARTRPRDSHQRARRHAPDGRARPPYQDAERPRPHGAGHDLHPLHGLDRRRARHDREDGRHARRSRRTSRC